MVLKVEASRASSSLPLSSMRRDRSRVVLTSSATPVSRRTGAMIVLAASRPRRAARPTPTAATASSQPRIRASAPSTSSSGREICKAYPCCSGSVKTRICVPSTVRSAKNAASVPAAAPLSRSVTGSSTVSPGARIVLPAEVTSCVYPAAPPNRGGGTSRYACPDGVSPMRRRLIVAARWRSASSTWSRSSPRTTTYVTPDAAAIARATATALTSATRVRNVIARAGRSRRPGSSGSAAGARRPRSCGAGSRCRRRASSSRSRSRSPTRARR